MRVESRVENDGAGPGDRGRPAGGGRAGAAGPAGRAARGAGRAGRGGAERAGRRLRARGPRLRAGPRRRGRRLQTHPDLAPYVERFANRDVSHRLSTAALETLAIVAYRQPVSRGQISALRGVNVDGVVRLLEQRGYIEVVGRAEGPGQPVLFGTTDLFLERLGLDSLDELPAVEDFLPGPEVAGELERDLQSALGLGVEAGSTTPEEPDGRAAPEGARPRRLRLAAGLRGADRSRAGSRVDGEVAVLGRRVDPTAARVEVDGVARARRARPRLLPAEQAGGVVTTADDPQGRPTVVGARARRAAGLPGRPARPRHRGPAHPDQRRRPRPAADPPLPRRGEGVPRRGGRRRPRAPGALRALREGVELDDGVDRARPGGRARARRAAHRHPRGPQPPGPADVRAPSATRCAASCAPGSGRSRDTYARPGPAGASSTPMRCAPLGGGGRLGALPPRRGRAGARWTQPGRGSVPVR